MRSTFGNLLTKTKQYTQNANLTDTGALAFLKSEINLSTRFIYAELQDYMTLKAQTTTTVAAQQYYQLPQDIMNVESITITIGTQVVVLTAVESQRKWDYLNSTNITSTWPSYFFVRRDDIGIWPIPQAAYTMTLNYTYRLKDMTADDYSTGTLTLTNGAVAVTGSATTFTAPMVGRFLLPTVDQYDYRIGSFTSTTSIALDNYFQGTTGAGLSYTIGESPEIPIELHELIPYRAAANYFMGYRKDNGQATYWSNMFWTGDPLNNSRDWEKAVGGLLGAKHRYAKRTNSMIIRKRTHIPSYRDSLWGTTISDS